MDMGMMQHSAPSENPASEEAVNHLFPCSVVFIMASTGGTWTLQIKVHNHAVDKEGVITIPVTVIEPVKSKIKSFTALHDGGKYFVSLVEPSSPKVGINDFEIAIYKKTSMMNFPADSSLTVSFIPEMPTMGHSSPNNINPVHIGNGRYKGKVNFTMTGLWRLNVDFLSGTAIADTTQSFDVEF
jgi:YtkA-like